MTRRRFARYFTRPVYLGANVYAIHYGSSHDRIDYWGLTESVLLIGLTQNEDM